MQMFNIIPTPTTKEWIFNFAALPLLATVSKIPQIHFPSDLSNSVLKLHIYAILTIHQLTNILYLIYLDQLYDN